MSVILLDCASLYWRAFFALPDSIRTPDGRPVNAVRGFIDTVATLAERFPDHRVIACWDDDWRPQWRVDRVPTYKAHRMINGSDDASAPGEETPDDLTPQVPMIRHVLDAVGIPVAEATGCEADDVIATYCIGALRASATVTIVSGDRDFMQLVDADTTLLYTGGSSKSRGGRPWLELTPEAVVEKYGIAASQYADMASLRGDPSDGLPGVPGIGEKTAVALVQAFGGLTDVLEAAAKTPTKPMTVRIAALLKEHTQTVLATFDVVALAPRPEVPPPPEVGAVNRAVAIDLGDQWGVSRAMSRLLSSLPGDSPISKKHPEGSGKG